MPSAAAGPSWLHLAALFGLSAATLAFEILLLRLFEFSHWHYFAGFAIALALLGLGAAGTTLALLGAGVVSPLRIRRLAIVWPERHVNAFSGGPCGAVRVVHRRSSHGA